MTDLRSDAECSFVLEGDVGQGAFAPFVTYGFGDGSLSGAEFLDVGDYGAAGVIGSPAMGRFVGRSCATPSLMTKL